ncbi:MAG: acyl-CoA dehydrogenase [Myxococcales bacterium]|nr:acyl-CoA dehydrogenase [Myxococcales bacterium]
MFIAYTLEQLVLRDTLRRYFVEIFDDALHTELAHIEAGGPLYHQALQRMGSDGWLGVGWPLEYGGRGLGAVEQFIFSDEVARAGFPLPFLTLNTVGPTLAKFGTDEQKSRYLHSILRGRLHFSIGYTEPQAGTDLASLKTRAIRDGDDYIVTGQKVFCSLADHADHLWLAVRTKDDGPKHHGISILIVDKDSPGLSMTPIRTLGDNGVYAVYLDGVRVPVANLVSGENQGWRLITSQLNYERVALFPVGFLERFLEEVIEFASEPRGPAGTRLIDAPWVRGNLARVAAGLDVLKLMNWRQAANIDAGALPPAEASAIKVYGSEFYVLANELLLEVLADVGTLQKGSAGVALRGRLERYYRGTLVLTFGGGANEIQRDIIAMAGLSMPRPPR